MLSAPAVRPRPGRRRVMPASRRGRPGAPAGTRQQIAADYRPPRTHTQRGSVYRSAAPPPGLRDGPSSPLPTNYCPTVSRESGERRLRAAPLAGSRWGPSIRQAASHRHRPRRRRRSQPCAAAAFCATVGAKTGNPNDQCRSMEALHGA